jgi:hypothetical protein
VEIYEDDIALRKAEFVTAGKNGHDVYLVVSYGQVFILGRQKNPVIQGVTDFLNERLKLHKVDHEIASVQTPPDTYVIVVPMQLFPGAVSENQKVRARKVEILLINTDGEPVVGHISVPV